MFPSSSSTSTSTPSSTVPSSLSVDLLIEQQFKLSQLQQLQQLQNQIFQQQIALISGHSPPLLHDPVQDFSILRDTGTQLHGLPTPGSSTELRPQPSSSDYVSPMTLHYIDAPQDSYRPQQLDALPPYFSRSAPANIAFPPSLPADLDFDITPLTSPWLGAHQQSIASPHTHNSSSIKRAASPSSDGIFAQPASKKPSPAIQPAISPAAAPTTTTTTTSTRRLSRAAKSSLSTPVLSRRDNAPGETAAADTPSPVDIFMLPPAPPAAHSTSTSSTSSSHGSFSSNNQMATQLTPVTPASMMNLGRLGIHNNKLASPTSPRPDPKPTTRSKVSSDIARSRLSKKTPNASPNLKVILPATNKSSSPSMAAGASISTGTTPPITQVRKTSHKAAEQKRRDSLKTTFDDLRGLLPPIPLPSDDNFPDERILPGALPPRGPPKAGGEGPNKGVSKLQLLMCGNDFIRQLKARVERRDDEIARLRGEVARLRVVVANTRSQASGAVFGDDGEGDHELDLERDLDAIENFGNGPFLSVRRSTSLVGDDEAEEDMVDL